MTDPASEFTRIKSLHKTAALFKEGGKPVVLLPAFNFFTADQSTTMDLLLVPFEHSGYMTRLFFERKIEGRGSNWNQHRVIDRNWWTPSWNHVPATLSWTAMLLAHLRAVA